MKYPYSIVITRGDDSNALNGSITITLTTDLDLTGYSAVFQVEDLRYEFNDITSKILNIVVSKEDSLKLSVGTHYAALKIYDENKLAKTVIRNIRVQVYSCVVDNIDEPEPDEPSEPEKEPEDGTDEQQ